MYKLPDDITSLFLKDEIVTMICFNVNQIYIHFDSSLQIAIEGQYSLQKGGKEKVFDVYPVSNDNGLLELLEKKIKYVAISDSKKDLNIHFDNISISLLGSDMYESYTIRVGERTIIV